MSSSNTKDEAKKEPSYEQHLQLEVFGFSLVDATSRWPGREHDALVWVGLLQTGDGRWLLPEEADELAAALKTLTDSHRARRAASSGAELGLTPTNTQEKP